LNSKKKVLWTWFPSLKPLECQESTNQTQSWSKVLAIHRFLSITHRFPFGFYYETAGRNGCTNLDIEAMDTDFHGGLQVIGLQVRDSRSCELKYMACGVFHPAQTINS